MTPAEAREIDRLEFAADCRAVRERALTVLAERRVSEREQLAHWFRNETKYRLIVPTKTINVVASAQPRPGTTRLPRRKPTWHTHNGRTMTANQWAEELGISVVNLRTRISRLGSMSAAIEMGGQLRASRAGQSVHRSGVVKNLPASDGTGGGSIAQDIA